MRTGAGQGEGSSSFIKSLSLSLTDADLFELRGSAERFNVGIIVNLPTKFLQPLPCTMNDIKYDLSEFFR